MGDLDMGQAEQAVRAAEAAYSDWDIDRIMTLFAPDIVFYCNGRLRAKGHDELRRWHEGMRDRIRDYHLVKTLRAASGDTICVEFVETWTDARTQTPIEGFGGEFWTMEDGLLAEWHLYLRSAPRDPSPGHG